MSASTTSYRAHAALMSVFIVIAGLFLIGAGVVFRLFASSPSASIQRAEPIQWLWFAGGGIFVLLGIFFFGFALGRGNEAPTCPHCSQPVAVHVHTWSGRLMLHKDSVAR